jgi:hypothetical protein|tara:strand:+ start:63 stop:293 length:231 start_codon:yes stop_codon:yes gene_type:complete
MKKPRNYKKEYTSTHGTSKGKLDRASRNKARKIVKPRKGMEVHHKNGNPRDNRKANLTSITKKRNRTLQPKRIKRS